MSTRTKRVVLDFDGVLHDDSEQVWEGPTVIKGPPVEGAARFVSWLEEQGYKPIVISARLCQNPYDEVYEAGDPVAVTSAMRRWLDKHGMEAAEIYNPVYGKPGADLYIDDKGYRFEGIFPYGFLE